MPLSLHQAFVPSALQMLGTASHLLDKTEQWCAQRECDHAVVLEARLIEDMLPFTYQIKSIADHTAGAIEGVRAGVYSPDLAPPPSSVEELRAKLAAAKQVMAAVEADEMESWIGRDMRFEFGETRLDFTAEDFLLSFAQPDFYFHTTAAYSIARHLGVPIGKIDFLGQVRVKQA